MAFIGMMHKICSQILTYQEENSMGKDDLYYSYDIETDEIVSKTRFNDDGSIDRWDGINQPGYGHAKYSSSEKFAFDDKGDVYNRSVGEDKDREWDDRDGVL